MCPWSLLTILTLFARWPTDTTALQCRLSFYSQRHKEYSEYLLGKKFTFDINLPKYLFISIVEHWSVLSIETSNMSP